MIACCDMQSKDGTTHIHLCKNLNVVMVEDGVSNVNFKGFVVDNA